MVKSPNKVNNAMLVPPNHLRESNIFFGEVNSSITFTVEKIDLMLLDDIIIRS